MLSIDPKSLPTNTLHSYLLSVVAPRPIAFASTIDLNGNPNLSPYSFFNIFSSNPPILIFSPSRRVRDNSIKHTLINARDTKEVVISVVNYDMVQQMSLTSSEFPEGVNEFEKAGLTMLKSDIVKPFCIAESPAQFECKVNEIIALGSEGGAGNLIICEIVKIHIADALLDSDGTINQEKLDLVARAGGNYYSRAKKGFFEIPKPLSNIGIGVDSFPDKIKNSTILTGNDLGKLATIESLPKQEDIDAFINPKGTNKKLTHKKKHKLAHRYLSAGDVTSAWKILLSKSK